MFFNFAFYIFLFFIFKFCLFFVLFFHLRTFYLFFFYYFFFLAFYFSFILFPSIFSFNLSRISSLLASVHSSITHHSLLSSLAPLLPTSLLPLLSPLSPPFLPRYLSAYVGHQPHFESICKDGTKLKSGGQLSSKAIGHRISTLQDRWRKLKDTAAHRRARLKEAALAQQVSCMCLY